jgi:hypothetical protein
MGESLCDLCRCLNFESLVRDELPKSHCISYRLGTVSELKTRQSTCQFCHLVICAISASWKQPPPDLIEGNQIACILRNRADCVIIAKDTPPSYSENWASNEYQFSNCRITITCDRAPLECPKVVELQAIDNNCEAKGLFDDEKLLSRRPEDRLKSIDFDLVRKWTSYCEGSHGDVCNPDAIPSESHNNYLSSFRLIDVSRDCIVDAEPGWRYVALSYVWGNAPMLKLTLSNKSAMYCKGSLTSGKYSLPQTIQDAITVVKRLNKSYIWVDALCIVQDDHDEKGKVIGEMDLIYSRAELTLVAASSSSATSGLPGLVPGSRETKSFNERMSFRAEDGSQRTLSLARSRPSALINASKWNSRGWCYQERLFSHRMLLFTNEQLIFWCGKSSWCEDTVLESDDPHIFFEDNPLYGFGIRNDHSSSLMGMVLSSSTTSLFESYCKSVMEVCRRDLSFEGDILDAIAGLLRSIKSSYRSPDRSLTFHFGLPSTWFEQALQWTPDLTSKVRRRTAKCHTTSLLEVPFPSWSWSGWIGQIDFEYPQKIEALTHPEIKWYVVDTSGSIIPLNIGEGSEGPSYPRPPWAKTSTQPRQLRDRWKPKGAPTDVQLSLLGQIGLAADPASHLVLFYSSCALLPIVERDDGLSNQENYSRPTRQYFIIGESKGWISLDTEWVANHPASNYEFVVIARQVKGDDWSDPGNQDSIVVMLIERCSGIAFRVGIGTVEEVVWANIASEWKLIQLG